MGLPAVARGRLWRAPKRTEDFTLSHRINLVGYNEGRLQQLDCLMFDMSPLSWTPHEAGDGILQAYSLAPVAGGHD